MRIQSSIVLPLLAALIAALGTAGCATTPKEQSPQATASVYSNGQNRAPETATAGVETRGPSYVGPWEDPASPLHNRIIYFDYDNAEIKPEYLALLRTHAGYLGSHADTRVTLEGHTDERGTREYNLALGDRRAEAVRRLMLAEGVSPNQLNTLSYGEERPADPGHGEDAWRQNRRVIIQY